MNCICGSNCIQESDRHGFVKCVSCGREFDQDELHYFNTKNFDWQSVVNKIPGAEFNHEQQRLQAFTSRAA